MMKVSIPKVRVTDKRFRYTPSFRTDLRATFARVRREIKEGKR